MLWTKYLECLPWGVNPGVKGRELAWFVEIPYSKGSMVGWTEGWRTPSPILSDKLDWQELTTSGLKLSRCKFAVCILKLQGCQKKSFHRLPDTLLQSIVSTKHCDWPSWQCPQLALLNLPLRCRQKYEALKATGHKIAVKDNGVFWMECEDSSSSERYCCFFRWRGGGVVRDTREVVVLENCKSSADCCPCCYSQILKYVL